MPALDVVTIGRSSVDLYGAQIGGRLEDMASFHKYIGGSPTNIACGTARLGLRAGLITRVGDEHMGRFIRETLAAEGVDTRGVVTDPERLTALVILGIRDQTHFPLIFYRENCADMALCEADIDAGPDRRHPLGHRHRHPPLQPPHRSRRPQGPPPREAARRPHRARHRLPPQPLGPRRPRPRRGALHRERRRHRQAAIHPAPLRPDRRHRGGVPHRRRLHRHHRRPPRRPRRLPRHPVAKRGPMGAAAFTAAIPDSLDDGEQRPGLPDRGLQRARRRRRLHVRPAERLADRRRLADRPHLRQRLRRAGGLPPRLHARLSVVAGTRLLPRPRRPHPRPAPRRRARTRSTGPPTACTTGPSSECSPSTTARSSKPSPTT